MIGLMNWVPINDLIWVIMWVSYYKYVSPYLDLKIQLFFTVMFVWKTVSLPCKKGVYMLMRSPRSADTNPRVSLVMILNSIIIKEMSVMLTIT